MKLLILSNAVRVAMPVNEARSLRILLNDYVELAKDSEKKKRAAHIVKELNEILG